MTGPARTVAQAQDRAAAAAVAALKFGTVSAIDSVIHLPKELFDRVWEPRWYPADFLPFDPAVQTQLTRPVQVSDNRDFVCMGGSIVATIPGAELTFADPAPYTVQVRTAGNTSLQANVGQNAGFVHAMAFFARQSGQGNTGRWPVAQFVPRNTTLTVVLNVLDLISRNVRVVLYGFDVY
jgi:hypothetical protein